ncbi:uncharacterized protein CTRU02_210728 [Colletotrichum truncatum]|uniref:Uncharacterized protein n=1 Tax=Colletotrichum truncatum TaxID=5467 RepID=A0ACC3YPS9_COLTU
MRPTNVLDTAVLLAAFSWPAIVTQTAAQSFNFDLGNLDRYQSNDKNIPSLEGDSLWMTGAEGNGFRLVLSTGLQNKVQKSLDECGDVKDECFQRVHQTLSSSTTHIDNALEKRYFGHLLSKTFKKVGVMITVFSSILLWSWEQKHTAPSPVWLIPQDEAGSASNIAGSGTVVMSGGGAPIMTITPPPDVASATGSVTPAVTFVATATADLKEGDRIVTFDGDFAKKFQDLLHIFSGDGGCKEGRDFNAGQSPDRQTNARSGGWDVAICAGLGVMPQVLDNGPLGDLRAMAPPQPPIQFDLTQAAGRAAQIVIEAARDYAPLLNIPAELIDQYGVIIFAMAINALVENIDIGPSNTIRAASLCDDSRDSGLQWDIFYGSKHNIVEKFCQAVSKEQGAARTWVVDTKGNEIPSKLRKRAPPVTPETYKDYKIGLEWKPSGDFEQSSCPRSCTEAYKAIASGQCGHNGRQGLTFARSGSWNIGCGTYSWTITPPARLETGEITCNDEKQFGGHKDVHENDVLWAAIGLCGSELNTELRPGGQYPSDKKADNIDGVWRRSDMHAWVKWKEGCVTTVSSQKVGNPMDTVSL